MPPAQGTQTNIGENPDWFSTTHWSVIVRAGEQTSPQSSEALSTLCETYWRPLYVYTRSRGYNDEEAKDLTQDFFARFLEKDYLKSVDRERGRFRSFLLASLKHFLANEWDKSQRKKRGGGQTPLSLDYASAEGWVQLEPTHDLTPEKLYERGWALALLERVLVRLKQDYYSSDKGRWFESLKFVLTGDKEKISYAQIAQDLNTSEGAIKVAVHRIRKKYREHLRDEIAQTVETAEDIEDEMRFLLSALE